MRRGRVVERLEQRFNHAMQFIIPDLLVRCVFLQRRSGFLPSGTSLKRRFLEEQLFQIVRGVKVGLLAGWYEDGWNLLSLQRLEIKGSEERIVGERLKAHGSDSLVDVLFQKRADRMQARHGDCRLRHRVRWFTFEDLLL